MYLGNLQLAVWDWIIPPQNNLKNQKKKVSQKIHKKIKIALSLAYPNSYFYNKRWNMLI